MTTYEITATKLRQLPDMLVEEVSDFIDFLVLRHNSTRWQMLTQFMQALEIAESDFADYLPNLLDYEERLARGEIRW
ncbi:MAG: hypothetical protein HY260_15380 [Chloroflexi bacterium]|nr:hypothetical protein [Chloroflexota bacterium]